MTKKIVYAIVACIVGYLIYNYVVPKMVFSDLSKLKTPDNKLNVNKTSRKEAIPITMGTCGFEKSKTVISTYDFTRDLYVDLKPSQNRVGGTQFSYSFWLRKAPGSELSNKVIFFRGNEIKSDKRKGFVYESNEDGGIDTINSEHAQFQDDNMSNTNDRFVKCPLVRFGPDSKSLRIEFNSLKNPHLFVDLDSEVFEHITSSSRNPTYSLVTLSFQDNFDFGGVERGIKVEVFLNKALVKTATFENNALRTNKGPIVLLPNNTSAETVVDADMVNLTYYNYAVEMADVMNIYDNGFKKDAMCRLPNSINKSDSLHKYHKLGLHNELHQID